LQRLRVLGIRLAIDDFGIGYSALSYLNRYPVDTLKLDRSFLEGVGRDLQSAAIIRAIVAFAGALSLTVTAEGIETAEQLRRVRAHGGAIGPGYYFARPMPAPALAPLLLTPVRSPETAGDARNAKRKFRMTRDE
jgi:EAL domain-containing protein (putative c-di-GMP-specific phosphodiesterase class I)